MIIHPREKYKPLPPLGEGSYLKISAPETLNLMSTVRIANSEYILEKMYRERRICLVQSNYTDLPAAHEFSGILDNHESTGSQENVILRRENWIIKPWDDMKKLGYEVDAVDLGEGYARLHELKSPERPASNYRSDWAEWITTEKYGRLNEKERMEYVYFPHIWTVEIRCHPHNLFFCPLDKEGLRALAERSKQQLRGELPGTSLGTLLELSELIENVTGLPLCNVKVYDDKGGYDLGGVDSDRFVKFYEGRSFLDYERPEISIHAGMLAPDILYAAGARKINYHMPTLSGKIIFHKEYDIVAPGRLVLKRDNSKDSRLVEYQSWLSEQQAKQAKASKPGFFSRLLGFSR